MFSNKQNINILTSLLLQHGVEEAVVCPGSRNAPIVRDLMSAGLRCHAVTDERCAAFYALGINLGTGRPVAVCVTSGSAVLNLLPGVAEAAYRHAPVIAITADRPAERIGQLDGQTLQQDGALSPYVAAAVDVAEPYDTESHVMANRQVNEALLAATRYPGAPVQINVRLSEPLMGAAVPRLPKERMISEICPAIADADAAAEAIFQRMLQAERPMVVVGQTPRNQSIADGIKLLSCSVPVLHEALSGEDGGEPFDAVLAMYANMPALQPDFVVYAGETLVSKRIKAFMQSLPYLEVWATSADGRVHDTFRHQTGLIHGDAADILPRLAAKLALAAEPKPTHGAFLNDWRMRLGEVDTTPSTLVAAAYKMLIDKLQDSQDARSLIVYYGNSTAVRMANVYARHYAYVNRGVNGIEGTLSTAAGHSLATDARVYCVLGDLSLMYDNNALWQSELRGNLRIVAINDGHGSIFETLPGIPDEPRARAAIMGAHKATAEGICRSYDINYRRADTLADLGGALDWLINAEAQRPLLLEINL